MILVIVVTYPSDFAQAIEGYYKDLFMDGGVYLTSRTDLPAAEYLGLSMEYLATSDQAIQNEILLGNSDDDNGVLLYPDKQPRFRCIYVNGGSATRHGASLGEGGRERVRDFYYKGGCYTGTCAGAFIVSNGTDLIAEKPEYFHIWPVRTHNTGLEGTYTGHFIPGNSPLLNYYDFGGDFYIDNVYHNKGCYVDDANSIYWDPNSEVLLRFDYPGWSMHDKVSSWAYKKDTSSGRLTAIGSHPEGITTGERIDLMAALLQYAIDGAGSPNVKATLQNSVTRYMNDNDVPNHEKVGDKQYHHFTVKIPSGVTQLTVTLDGNDAYDLDLFLKKEDFAFDGSTGVIEGNNTSGSDETIIINNPSGGKWYIGVKGVETITTTKEEWDWAYTGNVEVLNGVSYSITAEWDAPIGDLCVDGVIDEFDLQVLATHWLQNNMMLAEKPRVKTAHWMFDEGDGEYVYDSAGTNDGNVIGATWTEDLERGQCLSFDGEDDYMEMNDPLSIFSSSFTVSMWVKVPVDASGRVGVLLGDWNLSDSIGVNFEIHDDGQIRFYWDGAPDLYGSIDLRDGLWHLVTFVRDEDNHKVYAYVDTSADINYLGAIADKTAKISHRIGRDSRTGDTAFEGLIDDVRIYNYALDPNEISLLYEGSPIPAPREEYVCFEYPAGDLNEDCQVDFVDFAIFANHWLEGTTP